MATLIILLALAADPLPAKFDADGFRSPNGHTFAELAKLATTGGPDGYSITGKADYRARTGEIAFMAFQRYTGPVNVQFPRCHVGRTFEQIGKWHYWDQQRTSESLTRDELKQFKAACFAMLKSPEPWTRRRAAEHLTLIAGSADLQPLLAAMKSGGIDRGLGCIALAMTGSDEAVPAITKELASEVHWEQAAAALEYIGTPVAKAAIANSPRGRTASR